GDQRPGDDGGREPLIPQYDRQPAPRRQIAPESPRRLGAWIVAAAEIERQPKDDSRDFELREDRDQGLGVPGERGARQGLEGRGEAALDVGDRNADGLGTEVEAGQASLRR